MEALEVGLRTGIAFIFLLVLTRILGKKQVSQLTYFNYVAGITFGSITAGLFITPNIPISYGLISLSVWALFTYLTDSISLHYPKMRTLMEGQPTVIIKDGQLLDKALQSLRLTMDDVNMLLRNQKIFSIKDVDYAVFEHNGKISVLKKTEQLNVTKKDMNIPTNRSFYPIKLIANGKMVNQNLQKLNLNPDWVDNQLRNAGIQNIEEVFFAAIQEDGSLYVDKRDEILH